MSSALHPDGRLNPAHTQSNNSANPSIREVMARREFLKTSLAASATALLGGAVTPGASQAAAPGASGSAWGAIGFASVAPNRAPMADKLTVPPGYHVGVLVAWGDSLTEQPHWDSAGAMTRAVQEHCYGAHTDGMHYFPFPGPMGNRRGLLVSNSEYCDPGLVCNTPTYATDPITPGMVDAQLAAHGVNVVTIAKAGGGWQVQRRSHLNRRITGHTPCRISGPAAGHALLKTADDPAGLVVLGTLNNCSMGHTPWGTYLACEENFNGYFGANGAFTPTGAERRYGLSAKGFGYRWHLAHPRFDMNAQRQEPNRFGWVVEVDPWDAGSTPVKRTALGRFKHESATVVLGDDLTVAVYSGDDERNDYVYKFVSARKYAPDNPQANRDILDHGTLHVARFNPDGTGQWIPLLPDTPDVHGVPLRNLPHFAGANDADVLARILVLARLAADAVGATMMDRPEWIAVHPVTGEAYVSLTNNSRRGSTPASANAADGSSKAASANPPVDAANPRPDNDFGHILRWREAGGQVGAARFAWDIFVQCGDKATAKTLGAAYTPGEHGGQAVGYQGNIVGDDYGSPDGLWFDPDGRLWIETDQNGDAQGDWAQIGGNALLCADVRSGETRRFLTAVPFAEVTGVTATPDGRSLFIGIQHPGEDWQGHASARFTAHSTWPDSGVNGPTTGSGAGPAKPRSAVVVVTKEDGGVIGT